MEKQELSPLAYLWTFTDREERARAIWEGGWAGDPSIKSLERTVADAKGGHFQQLLAALGPVKPAQKKSGSSRRKNVWVARYRSYQRTR